MYTTVLSTCPICGDVRVPARDVVLTEYTNRPEASSYRFTCPQCGDLVQKPAQDWVVNALKNAAVVHRSLRIPAEAFEAHRGPAITLDDVLDLALQLEKVDDLARLAGARLPHPRSSVDGSATPGLLSRILRLLDF